MLATNQEVHEITPKSPQLVLVSCDFVDHVFGLFTISTKIHQTQRKQKMRTLANTALIFLLFFSTIVRTVTQKALSTVDDKVKAEVASFKGNVSLFAKNLDTGETYALNADDRVRTASTIKIAVMVEAFARVNEDKAHWKDELVLTKEKKVS